MLHSFEGKVAIYGYHCQLFDTLYKDWYCIDAPAKKAHSTNTRTDEKKQNRVEVLWVNYQLSEQ